MNPIEEKKDPKKQWIIFLFSTLACVVMLFLLPSWFWAPLPFMFTSFAYAMEWV